MKHRVVPIPSRGLRIKSRRHLGVDAVVLKSVSNTLQVSIEAQFMVKIFSNLIVMKETLVSKGTTIFLASLQIKMTETILFCNNLGFNMTPGSI